MRGAGSGGPGRDRLRVRRRRRTSRAEVLLDRLRPRRATRPPRAHARALGEVGAPGGSRPGDMGGWLSLMERRGGPVIQECREGGGGAERGRNEPEGMRDERGLRDGGLSRGERKRVPGRQSGCKAPPASGRRQPHGPLACRRARQRRNGAVVRTLRICVWWVYILPEGLVVGRHDRSTPKLQTGV